MKLEDQVVSLVFANRLNELGVKQESFFYHVKRSEKYTRPFVTCLVADHHIKVASAFSVAELGQMLPATRWGGATTTTGRAFYWYVHASGKKCDFTEDTEADARASLLIYLIEQGLIKPEAEKPKPEGGRESK